MTISNRRVRFRRQEGSRSSAEVVASNDDLLTELLRRLPIKSLLKFECVCKHWLSLITDPHFTRRKHLKSNAVSALYLKCYPEEFEELCEIVPLDPSLSGVALEHLDFAGEPRGIQILQSCNGLLLISSFEEKKEMVYNPTTKQSRTLPPLPPPPLHAGAEMMVRGPVLVFEPSESRFYKVVRIMRSRGRSASEYVIQILIYSSETGSWRVSRAPFNPPLLLGFWNGVYCNGAIHWLGDTDASLYFDLKDELVREMPMPPPLDGCYWWPRYFGESGGRLYLSDSYKHLTTHLNLYEMERDRSGWFLKYRVDPGMLPKLTMPSEDIHGRSVLYVARGEKEEDSFMVLHMSNDNDGKIIRYNFLSQTHDEVCEFGLEIASPSIARPPAHEYIESLALV